MADVAGMGDGSGVDPELDAEVIAAMSPAERERWMTRLRFAPVDEDEAGRLLAGLPPCPSEPAEGVIPMVPQADRPPLRRRGAEPTRG